MNMITQGGKRKQNLRYVQLVNLNYYQRKEIKLMEIF